MANLLNLLSKSICDDDAFMLLIQKFHPLLLKYAKQLSYEDAYYDLLTHFIQTIRKLEISNLHTISEPTFLLYIKNSIYHFYIRLSQEQALRQENVAPVPFDGSERDDSYLYMWDKLYHTSDVYKQLDIDFLRSILTKRELEVILYHYYFGYSVNELAKFYKVSKPAITQSKNAALRKLRRMLNSFTNA